MRQRAVNVVSTPPHIALNMQPADGVQGYITGMPVSINIPSLSIALPVIPGYYDKPTQAWTLTTTKAQFATPTAQPNNQGGNTFIYGHARSNIFGKLPRIQAGAVAIVTTDNGHRFYYSLSRTQVVGPSNSKVVLDYTGKPILTLQTCVGLLYQNRELLTFDLERVV